MKSLFLVLIIILLSCTSNVGKSKCTVIDPTTFEERKLLLSDYVDNISFIAFDTNFIFKGFGEHYVDEHNIILNTTDGIARFTTEGKFLNRIGNKGEGPMEYSNKTNMAVDPIEKKVYIYAEDRFLLYTFLFDGTYLKTKRLLIPQFTHYLPKSMIYDNGKLYFLFDLTISAHEYPQYEWATLDTCSNTPSLRLATNKVWERSNSPSFSDCYNNQLLYWNFYNDSIYHLKEDSYEVNYIWAKGDWRFSYEDGKKIYGPLRNDCLRLFSVGETECYLYITFFKGKGILKCIYDKKLKKGYAAPYIKDDIYHTDIKFLWENYYKLNGREYLSAIRFSYELKEELYKGGTPAGKEIADSIDEEAGLMLMLFKLKEKI